MGGLPRHQLHGLRVLYRRGRLPRGSGALGGGFGPLGAGGFVRLIASPPPAPRSDDAHPSALSIHLPSQRLLRRTGTVVGRRRDVGRLEAVHSRRAYFSRRSVVLAALPTQAARRFVPAGRHKKTTGLTEVGTATRGVSTLLEVEVATGCLECQLLGLGA